MAEFARKRTGKNNLIFGMASGLFPNSPDSVRQIDISMKNSIAISALIAAAASAAFGAETVINYPSGGTLPFEGNTSSLEINIDGDTNGSIVAVGPSAQIGVHGQDALAINYNSGTTLYYLSSVGSEGAINGNINVNVANGSFNNQTASSAITEALIGTAYGQSSAVISGNVNVSITNGEFYGNVFGGGGATVRGDTNLVISGGTFKAEDGVFAGNSWGGVTEGNSYLKITGGDFAEANVYAGNHRTGSAFSQNIIKGNANLVVEGGTFKNLNGGSTDGFLGSYRLAGKIEGNTSIVIRANDNIVINGDINASSGFVDGNAEVTFVGDASKLTFAGNVKAASASGNNGALGGRASIKIGTAEEAFTGGFNAKINDGFASLEVSNADTEVNFANAFNVETLSVESGAKIGLAEGTSFEKFSIVFEGEFSGGETIDYADVLADAETQTVVLSAIESGAQFTVFGGDQEWSTVFDNGQFTVGAAIPEPAEFAAFLGILAIFCAAARRR